MKAPTNKETRFTAEWEPEVHIQRKGRCRKDMRRKIITKDIVRIAADNLLMRIMKLARQGKETRLTLRGEDAMRHYPLADREVETMSLISQTMGEFRHCIEDIPIKKFVRRGENIGETAAKEEIAEVAKNAADRVNVSPDTVVTCPKCGTEFRVGKVLK